MTTKEWKEQGKFITVFKHQIFTIDKGNSDTIIVILHGYPTSSFDYYKVLPKLSNTYRVIIHDHLGFGFSDKPTNYSYSLIEQTDVALALWQKLGLKKVILLAHDYGSSIATEIIARHNKTQINLKIEKLILCNGSMHIELSKLRLIQKLLKNRITGKHIAKLTNYSIFSSNIRKVYFDKNKILKNELVEMWTQLNHNNGINVIHLISNYINERYFFWNRWIGALKETEIETKIIWAKNDPVAVFAIAELLSKEIKNNKLFPLENTGHFPMLENPKGWTELVLTDITPNTARFLQL